MSKDPDVLIAGAGPVGLFAALSLTRRGVPVRIADRGWRAGTHSYALALHPQSLGLLHEAGLLDHVMQRAYPVRSIGLYDSEGKHASIELSEFPGTWNCLAVLRQDALEDLLEDALRDMGVKVQWSHEVFSLTPADNHVAARVDKFEKDSMGYSVSHTEWVLAKSLTYNVPFVIGADGHRSRIRRSLKIDFPEVSPAQHYAVFEFRTNAELGDELRLVLNGHTTDVLWPLPDGYCRWSFEMLDYQLPAERLKDRSLSQPSTAEFPVLTEEHLREFLAARAPWFHGSIGEVAWRNVVRFERRLAPRFGAGRMWLAGDAAHLTGPVGVQSMNLGLSEADHLAGIIAGGGKSAAFDNYNAAWTAEWSKLMGVTSGLHSDSETDPWIAARGARLLACLPGHGEGLADLAAQVGLAVAAGASDS